MNASQAKSIPLEIFLARLGHEGRSRGGDWWYRSPLREEDEPSFRVSTRYNNWVDWGTGERGDIIDFARHYFKVGTVSEALGEIEGVMGQSFARRPIPIQRTVEVSASPERIELVPLTSFRLLDYLGKRHIRPEVARAHLQEVHYTLHGRDYDALAFPNRAGGFEIRNRLFKGTIGHKDISLIGEGENLCIYEGFMDFLTARQLGNRERSLVMNGLSLLPRVETLIAELRPEKVFLYLDNDVAGKEAAKRLPGIDCSWMYGSYKDYNEMLINIGRSR